MLKVENKRDASADKPTYSVGEVILSEEREFYLLAQTGVCIVTAIFLATESGDHHNDDVGNRKCDGVKVEDAHKMTGDDLHELGFIQAHKVSATLIIT